MLETTRNDFSSPWNVEPVFGPFASLWNDIVDEVAFDAFERMTEGGVQVDPYLYVRNVYDVLRVAEWLVLRVVR